MFRGREQSRPELGYRLLQRLAADVAEYGFVETLGQAGRPQHDDGVGTAPRREDWRAQAQAARQASAASADQVSGSAAADPSRRDARPSRTTPQRYDPHAMNLRSNDAQDQDPQRHHEAVPARPASGKIVRQKANKRHLLEHKTQQAHPPARRPHHVAATDTKRVKKLLNGMR